MNFEALIKKLSAKIGDLEVQNLILQTQLEDLAKQLEELKEAEK